MEKRTAKLYKLPPSLLKRVDAIRNKFPVKPTETACIEAAIVEWCGLHETVVKRAADKRGRK